MAALRDPKGPIEAFALDILSAAVVYNTMGDSSIRPSGTIGEPVIFGMVLDEVKLLIANELTDVIHVTNFQTVVTSYIV